MPHITSLRLWIGKFERELRGYGRITYVKRVDKGLNNFFKYFPNKQKITEFRATDGNDWIVWRRSEGFAYSGIFRDAQFVKNFFKWLMSKGEAVPSPFPGKIPTPFSVSGNLPTATIITREEVKKVLESCAHQPRTHLFMKLIFSCGLSTEELAKMTWENLNLETGFLTLPMKRKKAERILPLRKDVLKGLREIQEEFHFAPNRKVIQLWHRSWTYTKGDDTVRSRWRRALSQAGLSHRAPTAAKTYFGLAMLGAGIPPRDVQRLLGRKSLSRLWTLPGELPHEIRDTMIQQAVEGLFE